jgi:uncharacterized protein YdeI (BOF family)
MIFLVQMSVALLLLCWTGLAQATLYTVKTSGGTFSTLQACANTAVAGDTCEVYAGSYAGWTQSTNGSAGNPITFTAHTGDTVTLTGNRAILATNAQYITINGFRFTGGQAIRALDGVGITTSNIIFSNNTIVWSSTTSPEASIYLYGNANRIENNDASGSGSDFMNAGGLNVVIRNNRFHDVNGAISGEHIDFVQVVGGGTTPTLSFSLIENNVEQTCTNDSGNCHFVIIRTGAVGLTASTNLVRYNFAQGLDGSGASFGGVGDDVPYWRFYNNTMATETVTAGSANCVSQQNAPNGAALNNICYNTQSGGPFPLGGAAPPNNGNLAFTTGYAGTWSAPYSSEGTYNTLKNQNPLFASYPTSGTLQSGSPAINAGVALTTVAAGDTGTGTALIVTDARFFQPGWAGTQADWIRVGASTTAQIASIDYTTNTLTLTGSISRSVGNAVYLYKDSSGNIKLNGTLPDVGAYEFAASGDTTPPTAPTNLRITQLSYNFAALAWDASTDDTGVTGYSLEHCAGVSCSSYAVVGSPSGLGFTDSGLLVATSYTWRVRATDAASNLSAYSSTLTSLTDTVKFHPTINLRRASYEDAEGVPR